MIANLTYRDIGSSDFDAIHAIARDWTVARQLGAWPWPADPAFTKSRCLPFTGKGFVWVICEDDFVCGTIGIKNGSLGYLLAPSHHARGIMSRAVTHAVDTFFHAGATRLNVSIWHDNIASKRILEKHGFFHYATGYDHAVARNIPTLCYDLRLMASDWQDLRTAAQ